MSVTPEMLAQARAIAREAMTRMRKRMAEDSDVARQPITVAEARELPDADAAYRVFNRLQHLVAQGADPQVSSLQQSVFTLVKLHGEVGNGGFHQYFWNTQAAGLDGLQNEIALLAGTPPHGIIMEALSRAAGHSYTRSWLMMNSKWWWMRQFQAGYAQKRFDDLDERYLALAPTTLDLLGPVIRANAPSVAEDA